MGCFMSRRLRVRAGVAVLLWHVALCGWAADVTPGWAGAADLTFVNSDGNSRSTTLIGKLKGLYEQAIWRSTSKLEARNTSANDIRSAERYLVSTQADYKLTRKDFLFGLLERDVDRFGGYQHEDALTLGAGRDLIATDVQSLRGDAGAGARRSVPDAGDTERDGYLRFSLLWERTLSPTTRFGQEASVEAGEERTRTRSMTTLKTQLREAWWIALTHEIKAVSDLPEDAAPGLRKRDAVTSVGLNYEF
jgi:putative salt-induced outer membrane protein